MTLDVWLTFGATVLAFMITPGPSHLLMLSNSMTRGAHRAFATAVGDLTANSLQMLCAGLGLAAVLVTSQSLLNVVKWAGVAYLLWMGLRMWRHAQDAATGSKPAPSASLRALWGQGFLTSAANPKAVVFFAALFPQFIDPSNPFAVQFLVLSVTYLLVDGTFLVAYGLGASWAASRLRGSGTLFVHRVGSLFMIGAAIMLGSKTLRGSS